MHFAVIAAGEGSRLVEEGLDTPKPLLLLNGECMIDRLLRLFIKSGATSVSIIVNQEMTSVSEHLKKWSPEILRQELGAPENFRLYIVVETTPSSMHSFYALSQTIPEGKFCLTTVDTVFRESEFLSYIAQFEAMDDNECDGLFAVTRFVDDEKPLWVSVSSDRLITSFDDTKSEGDCYVSGGVYCMNTKSAFPILKSCLEQGKSRMRNFQRTLISSGLSLKVFPMSKIVDVDHVSDIAVAEELLRESDVD